MHVAEESLGQIVLRPTTRWRDLPFVDLSEDDLRRVRNGMTVGGERYDGRRGLERWRTGADA